MAVPIFTNTIDLDSESITMIKWSIISVANAIELPATHNPACNPSSYQWNSQRDQKQKSDRHLRSNMKTKWQSNLFSNSISLLLIFAKSRSHGAKYRSRSANPRSTWTAGATQSGRSHIPSTTNHSVISRRWSVGAQANKTPANITSQTAAPTTNSNSNIPTNTSIRTNSPKESAEEMSDLSNVSNHVSNNNNINNVTCRVSLTRGGLNGGSINGGAINGGSVSGGTVGTHTYQQVTNTGRNTGSMAISTNQLTSVNQSVGGGQS
jgi:hypothetical protein